ncbi:hypothetical protein AQUCO_05700086v1 [Aquilegia coerulea]|uniref:Uncharacterized protein n=1 Tax=Aquilegia coerulea TaxID=218851 RepID=A0A2G5CFT4_AQUCA|nr:hypothetical protein AQUCO_05700086v1 [Aquilegia coerulea]
MTPSSSPSLSSTSSSSSYFPSCIPGIPNLSQVAIKLDRTNYLLWKSQLLPILYGTDMLSMVDGTISTPQEVVAVNATTVINPKFIEWKKKDQILLSWIHATLTPPVFAQVVGYKTARETWEALDRAYMSQTNARYYQIKHELSNMKKAKASPCVAVLLEQQGGDVDA